MAELRPLISCGSCVIRGLLFQVLTLATSLTEKGFPLLPAACLMRKRLRIVCALWLGIRSSGRNSQLVNNCGSVAQLRKLARHVRLLLAPQRFCQTRTRPRCILLSSQSTMARPVLLPVSLCVALVMLLKSSTFVQAPARTVEGPQQQLRVMETAALSTGIAMTNALPAMATWSEGSEPGQNIDPDSTEAYNRKILNATAICF